MSVDQILMPSDLTSAITKAGRKLGRLVVREIYSQPGRFEVVMPDATILTDNAAVAALHAELLSHGCFLEVKQ